MTAPRIGSLFSGYGGLDLGVSAALGGARTAWHVEHDAAPSAILAERFPGVPNYGDVSAVDWESVEPVDVLTGGFPCQDVSLAGRRAGLRSGTRSGLWSEYARAIDTLRPSLVVIENVRGLLSAEAHSDVESCQWCVGDGGGEPPLRALGAVLGDLAELGYDARWTGIRASDAGAPHGRFRVFVLASPADPDHDRWQRRAEATRGSDLRPTAPRDPAAPPDAAGARREGREDTRAGGPDAGEGTWGLEPLRGSRAHTRWGQYEPAIRRWERISGRHAPSPTRPDGRGFAERLNPAFAEWMMGLPAGWVTDVPIGRRAQLKALGNGVVPQQAALALARLDARTLYGVAA